MIQRLEFEDPSEPVRVQEEPFSYLLVDVAEEGRQLYDGLDMVFESSLVLIDGKQAQRRVSLVDIPDILQVQLQRVQYDRAQGKVFKSNAHMSFGATLCMDRYLEIAPDDEEGMARRERTNACRHEMEAARAALARINQNGVRFLFSLPFLLLFLFTRLAFFRADWPSLSQQPSDASALLFDVASHLKKHFGSASKIYSEELHTATLDESTDLRVDIDRLACTIKRLREEIEEIWKDCDRAMFELVAVSVHRGEIFLASFRFPSFLAQTDVGDDDIALCRYCTKWALLYLPAGQSTP